MTVEEAIQILGLYDLGNMFLDIDGNPIGYEKMSSACDMAVEALRKQQTCDDCISRQEVINAIANTCFWLSGDDWNELMECINSLPYVTQKQKTGHWVKIGPYPMQQHEYKCSECYHETDDNTENYCSECGARMV